MKWYVKMALAFLGVILGVAALIIYDQITSGRIIYKTKVEGTRGEVQAVKFALEETDSQYVLIIHPCIEIGWGGPDVFIEAALTDPRNNTLITVDKNMLWGGRKPSPFYERTSTDYIEKFPFKASHPGEYTLTLKVLTGHVKDVFVSVGRKGSK